MGIKYAINDSFFKVWSKSMAYILGFIVADGCIQDDHIRGKYLQICSGDEEILEKIKARLQSEHKITTIKPRKIMMWGKKYINKEQYSLRIGSHQIYNDLIELGITPAKSKTISLPTVPMAFVAHFVRGYLDGDGCISIYRHKQRLSVTFTSGSKVFLEQLGCMITKAWQIKMHNVFGNHRAFQIKYSTREAIPLLKYVYADIDDKFYLERKYNLFLNFLSSYPKWREYDGVVPKWLRELSAKQLCTGSNPVHALHN